MNAEKSNRHIAVQIIENFQDIDIRPARLENLVKVICNRFTKNEMPDTKYEITIVIVDDTEIIKLNKQFLNHSNSTDCLSFDSSDNDTDSAKSFELVVNGQRAIRQAKLRGHSPQAELALYITHGLLHKLGFDDHKPANAEQMHTTEDEILQQLGYGTVYNSQIDN